MCELFCSELVIRHSQWKIYGQKDVLDAIFKNDLGRGYKNFQADYSTEAGMVVATQETKSFLNKLSSVMNVDAYIFGSYGLWDNKQFVPIPFIGGTWQDVTECNVILALYYAKDAEFELWWRANDRRKSDNKGRIISIISKSLASYVGKGTLRRL